MSKKYFINNLDTAFGQTLLGQLVKQPTQDPIHMCTVRNPVDLKPQGIKKILKREKPKLFRKKAIEECEVYVYNITQTQISDIEFGIETMGKPFEDNKVFILVSDIMVWAQTPRKIKKDPPPPPAQEGDNQKPPQPKQQKPQSQQGEEHQHSQSAQVHQQESSQEKIIEYTFLEDVDYETRVPHSQYAYIKQIEDKVLAIKRENVKVYIVCPGIIYGCGQDTFYHIFKASWLQEPSNIPYLQQGDNQIPTIHLRDLAKFIIKIAESPPEGSPYLLAIDQTQNRTQKALIEAISQGVGSGKTQSVKQSSLLQSSQRYLLNLNIRGSKILLGTPQEPVEFQWTARKGLKDNIASLLKDFNQKQHLRPIKIVLLKNDQQWKNSNIEFVLKAFSEYYRIPVLNVKEVLQTAKEKADEDLINDLREQWSGILSYIANSLPIKQLDQTMKVFYRAVRWRLTQNDCANRGFILYNFPNFTPQLEYIFKKISLKKLKRKKPKVKPAPPKASQKSISDGQPAGSQAVIEQAQKEEEPKQQEPEQEGGQQGGQQEGAPKIEPYYPQSLISIKKMGSASNEQVIDFFTAGGMEELVYDSSNRQHHEIFESLRNYLQRNGRPNNYLVPEQQLLNKHKTFTLTQNTTSLQTRQNQKNKKNQIDNEIQAKRQKLAAEVIEQVRNEGQQQIKKMPFRNYLMQFVVPTLNMGLLQVSNIIPNDPVDLLAEFLYQKSYDV